MEECFGGKRDNFEIINFFRLNVENSKGDLEETRMSYLNTAHVIPHTTHHSRNVRSLSLFKTTVKHAR